MSELLKWPASQSIDQNFTHCRTILRFMFEDVWRMANDAATTLTASDKRIQGRSNHSRNSLIILYFLIKKAKKRWKGPVLSVCALKFLMDQPTEMTICHDRTSLVTEIVSAREGGERERVYFHKHANKLIN